MQVEEIKELLTRYNVNFIAFKHDIYIVHDNINHSIFYHDITNIVLSNKKDNSSDVIICLGSRNAIRLIGVYDNGK